MLCALLAGCSEKVSNIEYQEVEPAVKMLDFTNVPVMGDARIIYRNGNKYEAFTDLVKFKDKYYISFREGDSHVWDADNRAQGHTKVIMSEDCENWTLVLDQNEPGIDLRDPKLSITPDGRLMIIAGGSKYGDRTVVGDCLGRLPRVSFSEDGQNFTEPVPIVLDQPTGNDWLWRVTWKGKKGYGFVKGDQYVLFKTKDGKNYKAVTAMNKLSTGALGDETTLRFLKDGTMLLLGRTKDTSKYLRVGHGIWGVSKPPYTQWKVKEVPMGFGGPNFVVVDDSYCIVATRWMAESGHVTVLLKSDLEGNMTPVCVLPSGGEIGNCSYPGLLVEDNELKVSYYSQHETEQPAIYFVKFPLSIFE